MNNSQMLWNFASEHPVIIVIIIIISGLIIANILYYILYFPFWIINRWLRSRNIKHQGWPPAHLDADGDFKTWESGD